MASLSSKLSSAVKSAGSKLNTAKNTVTSAVKNAGSNLSSQLKAVSGALGASAAAAPKPTTSTKVTAGPMNLAPNMTSAATRQPVNSTQAPNMTSSITLKPANSATAPKAPNMTSASTRQPINSSDSRPAPNMTDAATRQPTYAAPRPSSSNNPLDRVTTGLSGAFNAMRQRLGGNDTFAADNSPGVSSRSDLGSTDSYRGTPGTSSATYYSGQGRSLEEQARIGAQTPIATPESRAASQAIIGEWDSSAEQRAAQAAALQAQLEEFRAQQAAQDAMAPMDPILGGIDEEESQAETEARRLEKEIRKLTEPSPEYLAAQEEEQALLAEEGRVKDEFQKSLFGVKEQPIPMGFITGQGARLQDLANIQLDRIAGQKVPLQQKLADIQARRQAALDVVRTQATSARNRVEKASDRRFDYQLDEKKRKDDRADKALEKRYISIGDGAQLYDTVTGQVVSNNPKNFAPKNPPAPSTQVTDVGGRRLLIDKRTGQIIQDLGESPTKSSGRSI